MRPAHKLLKRFLRQRPWEIDWRETTTGKLRAELLLQPVYGSEDLPLYVTSTNPLTWLAWAEGRLDVEEITPSLSRSVCDALGLPAEERCYFMRHCREALARLCGRRAADKSTLAMLGAVPHHERLSRPRAVRTAQDCQGRTVTGSQGQHTRAQHPCHLLDFAPALKTEQLHAVLRYEPLTWLQPHGHLLN